MSLLNRLWALTAGRLKRHQPSNLNHRFIARVLAPPFFVLIILGVVIIWQLNSFVRNQAVEELNRAAATTAAKLEREFALRQTVLKRTGEELFIIKSDYQADLKELDEDRATCSTQLKQYKDFRTAPDNACEPFLPAFAKQDVTLGAIEDGYVEVGEQLGQEQKDQINERLTSFGQFFPETLALLVADKDGKVISSALSSAFNGSSQLFTGDITAATTNPVEGKLLLEQDLRLAIFAYPITGGSVLAAYDLTSDSFIKESWETTPIDRTKALTSILDSQGLPAYPGSEVEKSLEAVNGTLRSSRFATVDLGKVAHIATGVAAEGSNWLVVVASPRTVVLGPVRDAQIAAVLIVGTLLVGFLWVGTYFIQRTLKTIIRLVSGSLLFAAGQLSYRIKLDTADEEFISLANTMNSMAERIAAAEKEIDEKNKEFISIASHELRTPLTAIKGNLSMVFEDMDQLLDEKIKPLVAEAYKGTTRLATLVNDLLDMARLDGNRVEFVIEKQDMQAMAIDVVDTLRITANEKTVTLIYNEAEVQPVMADAGKLRIVLNNFVSNAIKYNRPSGSVTISHSLAGGQLVTAVQDTGLGIPDDQKAHMFEKFFRVQHEDRKAVVGTGLGMYITKKYIEGMNGKVWFDSVHGIGTTFYFSLPLATKV